MEEGDGVVKWRGVVEEEEVEKWKERNFCGDVEGNWKALDFGMYH